LTVSTVATGRSLCLRERRGEAGSGPYDPGVPPTWRIAMVILVACLLASMVIALTKLL
jgi:hypothetical protein